VINLGWARAICIGLVYLAFYGLFVSFGVLFGEVTLPGGVSFKVGTGASAEEQAEDSLSGRLEEVREASLKAVETNGKLARQLEDTAKELKKLDERLTAVEARSKAMDSRLLNLDPPPPHELPIQDHPEA
jgi:hypothetical protein